MPIFLPHHHLLVLFSSREEGNGLAEAEAAFGTRVMLHLGALKESCISYNLQRVCIQTPPTAKTLKHTLKY